MQLPDWTKPALMGAGVGAVALAIVGFSLGGWVTGGTAESLAKTQSSEAVAAALTPYCVLKAQTDPNRIAVMKELDDAASYQKQAVIRDAGWATPLGADTPNNELAKVCFAALTDAS